MYRVSEDIIDIAEVSASVEDGGAGAVVTFCGNVRNRSDGKNVLKMYYEADKALAENVLGDIIKEADEKFDIIKSAVQHRTGMMNVGETSVCIAVSAAHRIDAYNASRYIIDRIKELLPVWKKEYYQDDEEWLDGKKIELK